MAAAFDEPAARITLWAQVITDTKLDAEGGVRILDAHDCRARIRPPRTRCVERVEPRLIAARPTNKPGRTVGLTRHASFDTTRRPIAAPPR